MVTSEMIGWYLTQLDTDEQTARAATPGPWTVSKSGEDVFSHDNDFTVSEGFGGVPWSRANPVHIATWDPQRALATIAASRLRLDVITSALADDETDETAGYLARLEVSVMAGRPGYRQEWAPKWES
jgi:hypothetical protein